MAPEDDIAKLLYNLTQQDLVFVWSRTLTHQGRVIHICIGNITLIGSDNGLSPGRRQPII